MISVKDKQTLAAAEGSTRYFDSYASQLNLIKSRQLVLPLPPVLQEDFLRFRCKKYQNVIN